MSPRWQRILISGGVAIGVAIVAVPAVIAYALVRSNNDGSEADIAHITSTTFASAAAITAPRATPSPTPLTATPEPTQQATPEPTEEPLPAAVEPSSSPPVDQASPAPHEDPPPPTSTVPPPTPTILPVISAIFVDPGVLFEPEDAEIDGLAVTVQGTVYSRDFKIARIVWNWGDGTVEEGWFPARHTYARAGRYMWSVSVYDDLGIEIAGQSSPVDAEN
jgi:hypothetical protein